MPPRAIATTGTAEKRRYALNTHTKPQLRRQLEEVARTNGRSLTSEVEHRLEQSVTHDDAFGGPELRRVAYAMAAAFSLAGLHSAGPDVPPKDWLRDPSACIAAISAVVDTLVVLTGLNDEHAKLATEAIKGRVLSRIASRIALDRAGRMR
jgi:hypothetical protein